MKKLYLLLFVSASVLLLSSCSKTVLRPGDLDPNEWMATHDRGIVAYVDYFSGNYIVETRNGYSVVESMSGITPHESDREYAYFSSRGSQTVYNRSGNYFTQIYIVDSWLTWGEALYILDEISRPYGGY